MNKQLSYFKHLNAPTIKSIEKNCATISGYASIFNEVDYHNDVIIKGAFAKSIARHKEGRRVKLLWQHDQSKPIGVVSSICEDEKGLLVEANVNNTISQGREVISLIRQEALDAFSIGFNVAKSSIDAKGYRNILEADLWEVSVVTFPANVMARIDQCNSAPARISSQNKLLNTLSSISNSIFIL
jgi:HK97 family phage prohead protease